MNFKSIAATAAAILAKTIEVAEVVGPMLPAGGPVANAIKLATTIGAGIINSEPAMEDLYSELKAAAAGSSPPTAEQWDEWFARADKAHNDLQAALAE